MAHQSSTVQQQHHIPMSAALPPVAKSARPFVPKIDPFALPLVDSRTISKQNSSGGSSLASPLSASSGRRSPSSITSQRIHRTQPRRPPSPELCGNWDCAFPTFPTAKASQKPNSKSAERRAGSRTGSTEQRSARPSLEQRSRSSSSSGVRNSGRRRDTDDASRPSTANSSRRASASSHPPSRKMSIADVPAVPEVPPSVLDYTVLSDRKGNHMISEKLQTTDLSGVPGTTHPVREPFYTNQRPAHLSEILRQEPPNAEPPPKSPAASLSRFTSIFGRNRGKSTSAKSKVLATPTVESPRTIALSPDPDPLGLRQLPSRPSLDIPKVPALTISALGVETEDVVQPDSLQYNNQTQAPPYISSGSDLAITQKEPFPEIDANQAPENEILPAECLDLQQLQLNESEDLRRSSFYSASSYGSDDGFTFGTTSSRSTLPTELHSQTSSMSLPRLTSSTDEIVPSNTAKFETQASFLCSPADPASTTNTLASIPEVQSPKIESADDSEFSKDRLLSPDSNIARSDYPARRRPSSPGCRGICRGCSQVIVCGQRSISSKDGRLTGRYHKDCFVCQACQSPFPTAEFYVYDDQPYCARDYHIANQTLCAGCGNGIEGEYLATSSLAGSNAEDRKYHPCCLKCSTCAVQLRDDYFELGGKVYCERDAFRVTGGPRSPYGTTPSRPSPLNREYVSSVDPGQGLAGGRFPERRITRLMM